MNARHFCQVRVLVCLWTLLQAPLFGADPDTVFTYNFETGSNPSQYPALSFGKEAEAAIVAPGPDGKGHALRIRTTKPSHYVQVTINQPFPLRKNLVLSFDHREEIEPGKAANYLGVLFFDQANKQWFNSDPFGPEWKHMEIDLSRMRSSNGGVLSAGKVLVRVNLYGRAKSDRGEPGALMTVWLDNITLSAKARSPRINDEQRTSTSNPPFFNWPRGKGEIKLQYSTNCAFPAAQTTTVPLARNYHTPSQPLTPGLWYWRTQSPSELSDGWSGIQRLRILPEAHRFTTLPVPVAKIATSARPRVIDLDVTRKQHAGRSTESLRKKAEGIRRGGVPPDPPRYAPGNPDWPTWIDWYGKVHGGITSRTGRRLQQIAELAALTRDPQITAWTKEMVFAAAAWDPKGGSARDVGDIGAQHLLRGLSWCYDALHDGLSPTERTKLRDIIVTRAEQFWNYLNPFRSNEANNHAWLQTLALAETGLVLIGEHIEAADWAEYSRQLYLGRFLCCLGYQGDNNEGISYWGYGLSFVIDYADLMKHVCDVDLFQHPWLNQTARFPMYCAPPGAWAVSFADTGKPNHGIKGPSEQRQVRDLALRTRDPYALWYSGATNAVDGLTPKPPVDLPQSIHYRHIGWVIFNTSLADGMENSTFAMRSGPFYAGHQHDDQNGFVIHAYGEKLAIDSGYYDWYGSKHFTEYSSLTHAHNTILVNGKGQAHMQKGADGLIAAYFDSPAYGYTVGDASNPAVYLGQLKRFDRRVLFIKPGLVVIHDLLEANQGPARYDWLLHAIAPFETHAATQSFALKSGRAALHGRFLLPAKVALAVAKGYPVEPVDGYSTRPVPPEKYAHEWTLTTTPISTAVKEDFLAAFQIRRLEPVAEEEARIEPLAASNALGVRITASKDSHLVLFGSRESKGAMRGGELECDGTAVAVCVAKQATAKSAFATAATKVMYRDKQLFRSTTPVDWALLTTPTGQKATLTLNQPSTVFLGLPHPPLRVLLDGQSVPIRFDSRSSTFALDLVPGEHTIAITTNE